MPEGPGYQVFETVPEGIPGIAKAKSDSQWGRLAVQATIRAWFGLMVVEDAKHLKSIKSEWEERFSQLPNTEYPNNIHPSLRLQWIDLKPRTWARDLDERPTNQARAAAAVERRISPALENPPVNPITGNGRTAAEVAKETEQYKRYVREQVGGDMAIFQADYILVQLPGESLQLHRICSGLFIEDALALKVAFQTLEYTQTPNLEQEHRGGFWGEFTAKANPGYDMANKKSGTKFSRHGEISRDHIVLYDVQTVRVPKPPPPRGTPPKTYIRIHASALERLSEIRPEFPYPEQIPDSHEDDAEDEDEDDLELGEEGEEGGGESGEEGNEEDPPPVIPLGWQAAESEPSPLKHFVIWANVDRGTRWCTGAVTKVYAPGFTYRGKPYTHDATLNGVNAVRGFNLTQELKTNGYWLPIEPIPTSPVADVAADPEPAADPDPAEATAPAPARNNPRPARRRA